MNILPTGGAGFIGSHTAITLASAGHKVTIFDNLCNSNLAVIDQLTKILGSPVNFINGDVRDTNLISKSLKKIKLKASCILLA